MDEALFAELADLAARGIPGFRATAEAVAATRPIAARSSCDAARLDRDGRMGDTTRDDRQTGGRANVAKVTMPQLGESVAEGTIGKWLKQVGDHVDKYEPLLEVITDKVNAEVPSPFEGVLKEILAEEGATVPNDAEIAVIDTGDESDASAAAPATTSAPAPAAESASGPAGSDERPAATAPAPAAAAPAASSSRGRSGRTCRGPGRSVARAGRDAGRDR